MFKMSKQVNFDPRFKWPFTCMVSGPTMSGKSSFVRKLIKFSNVMQPQPERIIWCFDYFQEEFREMKGVEFHEGLPDLSILDGKRVLIIIDDLMSETDDRVTKIFTKGAHHKNASVIYITQNIFNKGKENRNISLNTQYLVLFKNLRDLSQIIHLGRQIFPDKGSTKYFKESFVDATNKPYGYLLVDLRTTTPNELRLRTNIFPGEDTLVYLYK
jgi:hypothetical protein